MASTDLADFLEWSRDKGIAAEGVEIRSAGEGAGNGVFAMASARPNSILIDLPLDLLLTAGKVAGMQRYRRLAEEKGVRLSPFEWLVVFFYVERPENSEYGPYLRMLPSSFDTPVARGFELKAEEVPLALRPFVLQQIEELKEIREKLPPLLASSSPAPFDDDRLLWAWHVVNTRCIYTQNPPHPLVDTTHSEDMICVVPFVDMLNHEADAQCVAEAEKKRGRYVVRAVRGVAEGSEVFVCYGPHDNGRLWTEYGFRLPTNAFTKVAIPNDLLIALSKKCGVKVMSEQVKAIEEAALTSTLYASDEGPSYGMRENVRLLHMQHRELTTWKASIYKEPRRRIEEDSDSDEDNDEEDTNHDDPQIWMSDRLRIRLLAETRTMAAILEGLLVALGNREKEARPEVSWMWVEQRGVVATALERVRWEEGVIEKKKKTPR